jgi:hypothetical protein
VAVLRSSKTIYIFGACEVPVYSPLIFKLLIIEMWTLECVCKCVCVSVSSKTKRHGVGERKTAYLFSNRLLNC